jgi:hypothetical protein
MACKPLQQLLEESEESEATSNEKATNILTLKAKEGQLWRSNVAFMHILRMYMPGLAQLDLRRDNTETTTFTKEERARGNLLVERTIMELLTRVGNEYFGSPITTVDQVQQAGTVLQLKEERLQEVITTLLKKEAVLLTCIRNIQFESERRDQRKRKAQEELTRVKIEHHGIAILNAIPIEEVEEHLACVGRAREEIRIQQIDYQRLETECEAFKAKIEEYRGQTRQIQIDVRKAKNELEEGFLDFYYCNEIRVNAKVLINAAISLTIVKEKADRKSVYKR